MIDRDALIEFVEDHRIVIASVTASVLVLLLCVLFLTLHSEGEAKKRAAAQAAARKADAIAGEELWIPAEPLPVPGLQFFRGSRERWSAEEAKEWYTVPDGDALEALRSAGTRLVDEILESVP